MMDLSALWQRVSGLVGARPFAFALLAIGLLTVALARPAATPAADGEKRDTLALAVKAAGLALCVIGALMIFY